MLAEILIILGIAIMMAVMIKKLPVNIKNTSDKSTTKESNMNKNNLIVKFQQFFNQIIKYFKNIKLSPKNKITIPKTITPPSSIRGKTVYPSEINANTTENNLDQSNLKSGEHFWNEQHRAEHKPLVSHSTGKAFSEAEELFVAKKFTEAEQLYIKAASEDPDNHKIFNRLGAIYMEQKNFSDAIEAFRAAVKIDPGIASRHYNLAIAYMAKGEILPAKRTLRQALEIEPTNLKYRKTLEDLS